MEAKPLTKAEKKRYDKLLTEIAEDVRIIEEAFARLGGNLKIIRDNPRLLACGGYQSFSEFCRAEMGSRQQVYRLIQAHDVLQDLLEQGVREVDLPRSESLCREIRKLETAEEQAQIWRTVQGIAKKRGRPPQAKDVAQATADLKTPSAIVKQQDELLNRYAKVQGLLKVSLHVDTLDQIFRVKLLTRLVEISESINATITTLRKVEESQPDKPEQDSIARHRYAD